ncbi:Xylose transport system permease protein xylH [Serratia rubidaea]|uniref:Xylose transport system permease protein xylH n=1 Tax=Serratia rubidaea TaxID=61652 RepID=A0A4U9H7R6_SERRU|nr:Xylose transport system permease protein xylH [Serratia rubidaea]
MVFVIISAEIDLSVGSMMGLLGGAARRFFDVWLGWPLPLTARGDAAGRPAARAWNGWWVAYRKVPSFIVTLAGMLAFRGILIGITNGTTVAPTSSAMSQIGQSYLPGASASASARWGCAVRYLAVAAAQQTRAARAAVARRRRRRRPAERDGGGGARRHLFAE